MKQGKTVQQGSDEQGREEEPRDLGFGSRVAEENQGRFLNKDGTFTVHREGLGFFRSHSLYHWLLTISWAHYLFLLIGFYFLVNILFALGYFLCGPESFQGIDRSASHGWALDSFFFSIQTIATIGYGRINPVSLTANILVTIESLVGLLGLALATGILFARVSRPSARILFSNSAVIAPYRGVTALEFRIANERSKQLIEVQITLTLSRFERENGRRVRRFHLLALERTSVTFFPLSWTVVHPIDESSPLHGVSADQLNDSDAEFLILVTAIDETFFQTVHARSSYKHDEVLWGAKFSNIFRSADGRLIVDLHRIHDTEPASS